MGFSVSASALIVALGVFIAFGSFYTATSNGYEDVTDAQREAFDDRLVQQNTAIEIVNATHVQAGLLGLDGDYVHVEVTNNGTTTLSVRGTDVIIDNVYPSSYRTRHVDGDTSTDLWRPGETLTVEVNQSLISLVDGPDRVKVVSDPGVADAEAIA